MYGRNVVRTVYQWERCSRIAWPVHHWKTIFFFFFLVRAITRCKSGWCILRCGHWPPRNMSNWTNRRRRRHHLRRNYSYCLLFIFTAQYCACFLLHITLYINIMLRGHGGSSPERNIKCVVWYPAIPVCVCAQSSMDIKSPDCLHKIYTRRSTFERIHPHCCLHPNTTQHPCLRFKVCASLGVIHESKPKTSLYSWLICN